MTGRPLNRARAPGWIDDAAVTVRLPACYGGVTRMTLRTDDFAT